MKKFLIPAVLGVLVLIAVDWYFILAANNSYEEKIQILSVMIEEADNDVTRLSTPLSASSIGDDRGGGQRR